MAESDVFLIQYLGREHDLQKLTQVHPGVPVLSFEKERSGKLPLIAIANSNKPAYVRDEGVTLAAGEYAFLGKHRGERHRIVDLAHKYEIPEITALFSGFNGLKVHFEDCRWFQSPVIYTPRKLVVGEDDVREELRKWLGR